VVCVALLRSWGRLSVGANFRLWFKNPLIKHRSKARTRSWFFLTWATMLLCMGRAWVREFSWPTWEGLLNIMHGGYLTLTGRLFKLATSHSYHPTSHFIMSSALTLPLKALSYGTSTLYFFSSSYNFFVPWQGHPSTTQPLYQQPTCLMPLFHDTC
jgi:hypothetical protein